MKNESKTEMSAVLNRPQRSEITEHCVYITLARTCKNENNRSILRDSKDANPTKLLIAKYWFPARLFGLTFALKLMKRNERSAEEIYKELWSSLPEVKNIIEDEDRHESPLISLLRRRAIEIYRFHCFGLERRFSWTHGNACLIHACVRECKDHWNGRLIAGIVASFLMGISEYLSTKAESDGKSPMKV